ncbi:MAG: 2-C-methyl-D-erythritol 4-phosphate cytidylyltransferase [Actinomycetaceae bacterium]|nr:2-C-methyl-D-erythritol 4-phosphate cytidylyltransferase [Actinomycetaceae bacterium]
MSDVFVVVTAAGSGTRLGFDRPKALVELSGQPLVVRAVNGAFTHPEVVGIVVTAPEDSLTEFTVLFDADQRVRVVPGGAVRQESVYRGLEAIPDLANDLNIALTDTTPVLIHDAARCLAPTTVFHDVVAALDAGYPAVIPALPVTDTQKTVASRQVNVNGITIEKVIGAVDRTELRAVQTPQGFHWQTIINAHRDATHRWGSETEAATDDGALVEACGIDVHLSRGSQMSLKITTKLDLIIAEHLLTHQ